MQNYESCLSLSAKQIAFAASQKLLLSHALFSCLGVVKCRMKLSEQDQVNQCSTEDDAK